MTEYYMAAHGLIRKNNQFLVTRRSIVNDYMPLKWDIPGGFVESGESVEDGLKREITEETNIEVSIDKIIYVYTNLSQLPKKQVFQAVYLCEYVAGEICINPEEHDQFAWISKEQMFELEAIAFFEALLKQDILQKI
jgi:8-oxo-dGTP diphosphatase